MNNDQPTEPSKLWKPGDNTDQSKLLVPKSAAAEMVREAQEQEKTAFERLKAALFGDGTFRKGSYYNGSVAPPKGQRVWPPKKTGHYYPRPRGTLTPMGIVVAKRRLRRKMRRTTQQQMRRAA